MKFRLSAVMLAALTVTQSANGYEQETHALITHYAFGQSVLSNEAMLQRLGLDQPYPLGKDDSYVFSSSYNLQRYIDFTTGSSGTAVERSGQAYDNQIVHDISDINKFPVDPLGIESWLMRGAIREDDNPFEALTPHDAPPPTDSTLRPLNHFFDPWYNQPLTIGVALGDTNPNWAIGTSDAFAGSLQEKTGRTNHFTIFDAREAMWRALTLKKKDGTSLAIEGGQTAAYNNQKLRHSYWTTVFRSLGDVLHLNQDMAQPQHTRNEAHNGLGPDWFQNMAVGHSSYIEVYLKARAIGATAMKITGENREAQLIKTDLLTSLPWGSYPVPKFNSYPEYWSSGGFGHLGGQGLADYSNNGFFTPANNVGDTRYPYPAQAGLTSVVRPYVAADATSPGMVATYLEGRVTDNNTGTNSPVIKMSRRGAFAQWGPTNAAGYMLDRNNYDDMVGLLLPRAAAYSAGIINYFFRGKMEISLPDTGVYGLVDHAKFAPGGANYPTNASTSFKGFDKIKLKLKNTTDPINTTPQSMTQGTLVAILKFHRNTCYKDDLSGELNNQSPLAAQVAACRSENEDIAVSDPLPPRAVPAADTAPDGVELTFTFSGKQMPMNAWDVSLQVVYRGKLGSEDDAVAVATKDISEPTHVVFFSPFGWESKWSVLNLEPPVYPGYSAKFKLSFGPSQTPVTIQPPTEKSNLLVSPYFSRFAMLQDLAKPVEFTVACNCFSNSPFVEFLRPYVAQQGKPYEAMESTAGIAWWGINLPYTVTRAYIGGTPPAAPNADDVKHVPALPDWARYPVPVEISGW